MSAPQRTLATLELVGGNLVLDLANTINSRVAPQHDYLSSYADLLAWGQRAGMLATGQVRQLAERAGAEPQQAALVLEHTRELRELVYRIWQAIATGNGAATRDLAQLQAAYGVAAMHGRLLEHGGRFELAWTSGELDDAYWPLAWAAGELLRSPDLARVHACPSCGWLFVDTSKNGRRRWCSMATCGAQQKMRRYRLRQRRDVDPRAAAADDTDTGLKRNSVTEG